MKIPKRHVRITLLVLGLILALVLVGPFMVPVPPLEGTVSPEELADPDSEFIQINELKIHYKIKGTGQPVMVLLHGSAASTYSWREVIEPLAETGTVIVFDRPASGLTERPLYGSWQGDSPYSPESQVALTVGLMDELSYEKAVLVGNSAGGTIAAYTARLHPERVLALVLVDAAIYVHGGTPDWIHPLLLTPQARRLGPLLLRSILSWGRDFTRSAWHDPSRITPEIWEGYTLPLQAKDWDEGLWELTLASHPLDLAESLDQIQIPVLVITGDDDRIVPTEQSIRLGNELPNARLVIIPNCGHLPQEECPEAFLEAVREFVNNLPNQ